MIKKSVSVCTLLTVSVCVLQAQTAGLFDFEVTGELSGDFRPTFHGNLASEISTEGQSFTEISPATVTKPWIAIYDTVMLDFSDSAQTFSGPFTLTLDVTADTANSSFGIFLFDAAKTGNNLPTIFNRDSTVSVAGNEQIRLWRDTSMTTSGVSNLYSASKFSGRNDFAVSNDRLPMPLRLGR